MTDEFPGDSYDDCYCCTCCGCTCNFEGWIFQDEETDD